MENAIGSTIFIAIMIFVYFGMFVYCTSFWKYFWLALFLADTYAFAKNIILITTAISDAKNNKK
jgi:hypothetical protein